MSARYLEIVSKDANSRIDLYSDLHGLTFGSPDAIASYAERLGIEIVRSYADEGVADSTLKEGRLSGGSSMTCRAGTRRSSGVSLSTMSAVGVDSRTPTRAPSYEKGAKR